MYPLHGVVSVVLTPFDENDRIDLTSLERSIEDRIGAGVAGILVPAVAGEVSRLTDEERRLLIRSVTELAAGRVPVIAGTSAPEPAESVAIAELARELGCAGVLVQPPAAMLRDGASLRELLDTVASTGVEMIMLQDLEWNGPGIPVGIIRELFEEVPAFRCIKIETVPAGPKYTDVLRATDGELNVSGGWASLQLIEALDRGVHAFMPSAHHWVYVEIVRCYRDGRRDGARALFEELLPMLAFTTQHIDVSIQFQKLLAVRQGVFATAAVRSPSVVLDSVHRALAGELVERAVDLHRRLGRPD